jgi:Fe-S oxidoreductase
MINFNLFVLPFSLGLLYLLAAIGRNWYRWIRALPMNDKLKLRSGIRQPGRMLRVFQEVALEGLIHRRMWKRSPLLGYMHMSFALGWFLLILFGNMESRVYSGSHLNAPYYPIFLKFFIHDKVVLYFELNTVPGFFRFIMDFLLLFILSGLVLAIIKRKKSKWFGMNRTTHLQLTDWIAMICLWLIFPLRLLAEGYTAGFYKGGGSFLTQPVGYFLTTITPIPANHVAYTLWWGYSLILGIFFITMPYSRYMHIPTEVLLIFFRHFGIQPKKWFSAFSEVEVYSCSRCGVCIDACQMNTAGIHDAQTVYFIRGVRDMFVPDDITRRCMICGRCQEVCPVGINTDSLRMIKRRESGAGQVGGYGFLHPEHPGTADVAYFVGCMSHLTPTVIAAMKGIMQEAGTSFVHMDAEASICCGRPLMLSGKDRQAAEIMEFNKALIRQTRAQLLMTSCPICYRVFKEEYNMTIRIQHHTQFLFDLARDGKLIRHNNHRRLVYHDPCDLGRGSGHYDVPRNLLDQVADVISIPREKKDSQCCGGSLGLFTASLEQRDMITRDALRTLMEGEPECLVTACPLCKKTFAKHSPVPVIDVAEVFVQETEGAGGMFFNSRI